MQRLAVIANLLPGATDQAEELIKRGPPFDPSKHGIERHTVFLAQDTAVFVFEGGEPRGLLSALSQPDEQSVLGDWEPLLNGTPRVARELYSWVRPDGRWQEGWGE